MVKNKLKTKFKTKSPKKFKHVGLPPPPQESEDEANFQERAENSVKNDELQLDSNESSTEDQQINNNDKTDLANSVKSKNKEKVKSKSPKKVKHVGLPPPPQESEDEVDFQERAENSVKNDVLQIDSNETSTADQQINDKTNIANSIKRKNKETAKLKSPKKFKHVELPPLPQDSENELQVEETVEETFKDDENSIQPPSIDEQPINENVDDVDNDEMDLGNNVKPVKKRKKGIIYISNIPKHLNVTLMREILGEYGKIGRVYLQPEKKPSGFKKLKQKPFLRHFTEGWVEFESKSIAKQIVPMLNNKNISTSKKSQFYDYIWTMKYLPRFKWFHLTERMNYEQAVHKQRLMNEVSQARKETNFFQDNLDKSEFLKKKNKKNKKVKKEDSD